MGPVKAHRKDCHNTTHVGVLIIRIGFWGVLYHKYNKEPQKSIGNSLASAIHTNSHANLRIEILGRNANVLRTAPIQ